MGIYTSVKDGTGAGRRKSPAPVNKQDWTCSKGHKCKHYWFNCPSCFEGRPREQS